MLSRSRVSPESSAAVAHMKHAQSFSVVVYSILTGIMEASNGLPLGSLYAVWCQNAPTALQSLAWPRSSLCPRQLGVGTTGGCEAAIHPARRYLESMPEDHVMVKLDFSNAFNCLHRRVRFSAVQQYLPDIYSLCYSAYSRPTPFPWSILDLISRRLATRRPTRTTTLQYHDTATVG
jgi:hypothetical protein